MTLERAMGSLRDRWLFVLVAVLLGLCVGGVVAGQTDRTYEAKTVILLRPAAVPTDGADYTRARYAALRARDYRLLVQRTEVLNEAIEDLQQDLTPGKLRPRVSTDPLQRSPLIIVRASGKDPDDAARVSTAVSAALSRAVEREEASGPERFIQLEAPVAVAAVPAVRPLAPRMSLYLAVGMLAGAAVGVCGALLLPTRRAGRVGKAPVRPFVVSPVGPPDSRVSSLTGAHVAWILLVAASIPWRTREYYDGGVDPVVLGKAGLAVAALVTAWLLARVATERRAVAAVPVLIVCAYLAVTLVGGLANQTLVPAAVVAARVAVLLAAICLLLTRYGISHVSASLIHVLTWLFLCSALTGLPAYDGRLAGGIPALHPNALAAMAAIVCVWALAKAMTGRDTNGDLILVVACILIIFLTGSRTSLAALIVAVLIMLLRATRMRRGTFLAFVSAVPGVVYLLLGTDLVQSVALRGGSDQVMSLSNRLIAWEAAFAMTRDWWQTWFGQGLAYKHVQVDGQFWGTQLLDSSWISAWMQGGILGLILVILLTVVTLLGAAFRARADGPVWLGLAVLLSIIAIFESGLFDASVLFLAFITTALGAGLPVQVTTPVLSRETHSTAPS